MENIKLEYSVDVSDYIALEKYGFTSNLNESYAEAKKKNRKALLVLCIMTIILIMIMSRSLNVFIGMVVFFGFLLMIMYKKLDSTLWKSIERQIRKNIIHNQLYMEENNRKKYLFDGSSKQVTFIMKNEQITFTNKDIKKMVLTDNYLFIFSRYIRGMVVPLSELTTEEHTMLKNWIKNFEVEKGVIEIESDRD